MRVLIFSGIVLAIDQITKLIVKGFSIPFLGVEVKGMNYGSSIPVFGDFFKITFVENPGMAFGIDVNSYAKLFLSLFSLVAAVGLIYYLYLNRDKSLAYRLSLSLIIAGALGNFIDRAFYGLFYGYAPLFYGKVVDFFNVDFFDFSIFGRTYNRWPIFNIADSAVTVGVFLLVFYFNRKPHEEPKNDAETLSEPDLTVHDNEQALNDGEDNKRENIKD